MLTKRDAADLAWFFSEGVSTFERSSFGAMLERASTLAVDSTGQRIEQPDRSSWHVMPIKQVTSEPSYTPDLETMVRAASVSRRLARVERADPLACAVLEAYHGAPGDRWARTPLGRVAGVYPLTSAGREHAASEARSSREHIRTDDRIALVFVRARVPEDTAARELAARIESQARKLLRRAWSVWEIEGAARGR
jgi:hypothetical protein